MACTVPVVTIFLICLLFLPIGLTLAFGVALYSYPKMISSVGIGYHAFCIIFHAIAIITFYLQRIKERQSTNPFSVTCATVILVILQSVFCIYGIILSTNVASEKHEVKCAEINSTDYSSSDANGNEIRYMNRECSLELYFFFGATLVLLFRLPTILWGLCDRQFFETPTRRLRTRPQRRDTSSSSPVYFVRPPAQSSVYPEPPPLPPPPAYHFENDSTSMDFTKLPTYDQAVRLTNDN